MSSGNQAWLGSCGPESVEPSQAWPAADGFPP